ncbi:MAG: Peptidase inhibitor family [Actinomycetia bacterium]|nr:Peptidase inhibitor family [Actinomycetes bacterium]
MHSKKLSRRTKIAATLAAAAALGAATMTVTSANAATVTCGGNEVCLFGDGGFNGTKVARQNTVGSFPMNVGGLDDRTSSIWNNSNNPVAVYQDPQLDRNDGACAIVRPHTQLRNVGSFWNDRISLIYTNTDQCYAGAHKRSIP